MDLFTNIINEANNVLWTYVLIIMLLGCAIWFSVKTRFVQFRMLGEMIRLLGDSTVKINGHEKHISSFQAFTISLASRVGTGNLAGVATALTVGGPGAIFWMWIIALLGSSSAFVESTLAQLFKVKGKHSYVGGPAYYMERGLKKRWMGVLFAVLITVTFGLAFNSVQSNTMSAALQSAFSIEPLNSGIVISVLTLVIIFGGVHRIAAISSVIVPVMAVGYIALALFVVLANIDRIPAVVEQIVGNAFGWHQAVGGGIGTALMQGIKRGLFSNEAGMGSAPNAAATAHVTHPAKQGFIQALGVFTDTLLICSCTAFIILFGEDYIGSGLDVIRVVLRRARNKRSLFMPDKTHIHHKFLAMGFSPRRALVTIQLMSACFCAFTIVAILYMNNTLVFVIDVVVWTLLNLWFDHVINRKAKNGE